MIATQILPPGMAPATMAGSPQTSEFWFGAPQPVALLLNGFGLTPFGYTVGVPTSGLNLSFIIANGAFASGASVMIQGLVVQLSNSQLIATDAHQLQF
jgi:hypothetical protein